MISARRFHTHDVAAVNARGYNFPCSDNHS